MGRKLGIAAVWILLAALSWGAVPGGGENEPIPPVAGFEPDTESANGSLDDQGAWTFLSGGIAARLTPLDAGARLAWLKEHTGAESDPFAGPEGEPEPFITFHLVVANGAPEPAAFEPQKIWLRTNKDEIRVPLDRTTMRSAYRLRETEMPPAYEAAAGTLLDGEAVLGRGQRVAGLVVFKPIKPRTRWFHVEIHLLDHQGTDVEFRAVYRKIKDRRKADGKG